MGQEKARGRRRLLTALGCYVNSDKMMPVEQLSYRTRSKMSSFKSRSICSSQLSTSKSAGQFIGCLIG